MNVKKLLLIFSLFIHENVFSSESSETSTPEPVCMYTGEEERGLWINYEQGKFSYTKFIKNGQVYFIENMMIPIGKSPMIYLIEEVSVTDSKFCELEELYNDQQKKTNK